MILKHIGYTDEEAANKEAEAKLKTEDEDYDPTDEV